MTVWRKVDNENCYAVAIYNYTYKGNSPVPHLDLEVGELVHVQRETKNWYWGSSLRRDAKGAFPASYVVIRDSCVVRCGETVIASAGGSGLVHDIAITLREWLQHWKKLYLTNDDRFKFMEVSMHALLKLRAEVATGALPQDQMRKVARTAVFTIDRGNRALGMELAVRNADGQLISPLKISTYELNAMHEEANDRINKNMETTPSRPTTSTPPTARTYTIVVKIHNFVCRVSDNTELLISLHDAQGNKLTEHLLMKWSCHTAPTLLVFTDLGTDIKRDKLFLVCQVVRVGSMDPHNTESSRRNSMATGLVSPGSAGSTGSTGRMRRAFGAACADVTRHVATPHTGHVQLPFYPCEKENMDTLLKKIITNRDPKDTKHSQGLWVSLELVEGDLKQIREENPHLIVGNVTVARKMGFPEVILPGDARNDLYVTLVAGSFAKGGAKSTERNIELCARVVDKYGRTVPGVISVGAGMPLADSYTSLVYYHDDRPRWQEVFKVCLNIEMFKEAHLVFFCRHRSSNEAKDRAEKHFALSYLKLMQPEGTTLQDGLHHLCVYKIDYKKQTTADVETAAAACCVALPSTRSNLPSGSERGLTRGPLALLHRDTLSVQTSLCSTKLTQREEILGVLKWSTQHAEGTLRTALTRLLLVPSEELVKFLQDILDALFNILTQLEEDQEGYTETSYSVLVLDCLIRVLAIVSDHKFQHFQPVLHVYIDRSFCDALAYEKLISVMVWVITSAECGDIALKRLLQCMKCLECLVRLIVRSRQLRSALGDSTDFCYQFETLLESLVWLMRCGAHALTCQGAALKFLPHAVPHVVTVYPAKELSAYIARALSALPLGRLSKQRMLAHLELCSGELWKLPACRAMLLPHLADTVKALLKVKTELDTQKSRSVDKAARLLGADSSRLHDQTNHQQIVELCVDTLGKVVTLLARDDVGPVEADIEELARRLLPTVMHLALSMLKERKSEITDENILRRAVCVMLDMVRQMSLDQYTSVVRSLEAESAGSSGLVGEALSLLLALLNRSVFSKHWADIIHLQCHVMLHALELISTTLNDRLHSEYSDTETVYGLYREWFYVACTLACNSCIQVETFSVALRRRFISHYGDVRRHVCDLINTVWNSLGDHKRYFILGLVGPLLEVSFLCDEEVRNKTIPLFFDMMETEYACSAAENGGEGNLKELESEFIDKIDVLIENGMGDEAWRNKFAKCGERATVCVAKLTAAVVKQLRALLQYRCAAEKSATPHRMHLTTKVLHFYEMIDRPHMYIRYVHKLAKLHMAANQWAEAGLSLRLHAKLLLWTNDPLPTRLAHPTQRDQTAHREVKESLYLEIAELLNRGRQWELAVQIVKELVSVYEEEALGYGPLVSLHSQLADLYGAMLGSTRLPPGYFRVIYHGRGFPDHLRVEHGFVYRGNEYEQLQVFNERLLDEWPDAEVLPKLDPPGKEITESDGQYLQINAVEPVMCDKMARRSDKPVAEQILKYYKHNNVDKFVYSRPVFRPEEALTGSTDDVSGQNEFATRWLERTELEISDKLPGILRWFPVVKQRTYWVSPIEAAVESLSERNRSLKSLIMDARNNDTPLQPLTMMLNGTLDPAVQGGIANYEKAFLTKEYLARHPENEGLVNELKDLIAGQIPLLKYGLEVHEARAPPELELLHSHLHACFLKIQSHVHQRYGKKMYDFKSETPEVQLRNVVRDHTQTFDSTNTHNRMSDISTGNESASKMKFFSFNSTRNSGAVVANYFGTLQSTPKRRDKRRARKSEVCSQSSASQWYTSNATTNGNNNNSNNNTNNWFSPTSSANSSAHHSVVSDVGSPLRELRQELVTERPLRAEVEKEKRLSQRASLLTSSAPPSNRDSMGTTDSNQEEDEPPPPLPQKSHRIEIDTENNNSTDNSLPIRNNYDTVFTARGSFLYNSMINRRHNVEKPPTPPPKKKNSMM